MWREKSQFVMRDVVGRKTIYNRTITSIGRAREILLRRSEMVVAQALGADWKGVSRHSCYRFSDKQSAYHEWAMTSQILVTPRIYATQDPSTHSYTNHKVYALGV